MVDAGKKEWEADPPRFVKEMLARESIFDGAAHVTAEPHLAGLDDVEHVLAAITDRTRSVSVIVAASLGSEYDAELRVRVSRLTAKVLGVAAVYFVTHNALDEMNRALGQSHAVPAGRIRTYLPLVDLQDDADARRHRVLGPATFARAIRGRDVAPGLKSAFALETRAALLARPLPTDLRRGMEALDTALRAVQQEVRIRTRVQDRLAREAVSAAGNEPAQTEPPARVMRPRVPRTAAAATVASASFPRMIQRIEALVHRWLDTTEPISESSLDGLELRLTEQSATAEVLRESASAWEAKQRDADERATAFREERDELDLELAIADEEATALRLQIGALQSLLREAKVYDAGYESPALDPAWETPQNLLELADSLRADSANRHAAFDRIEFTGDLRAVEAIQKRDLVGRYAGAFWDFVHTLHDYAQARDENRFEGNVHQYLRSDAAGHKCSSQRHAAKESESVLSNTAWRRQRMLPVPVAVDPSGSVLMEAHFRPTHADTVAPRMHYFDDTAGTGKVYIGYIGRHLDNTKTRST